MASATMAYKEQASVIANTIYLEEDGLEMPTTVHAQSVRSTFGARDVMFVLRHERVGPEVVAQYIQGECMAAGKFF